MSEIETDEPALTEPREQLVQNMAKAMREKLRMPENLDKGDDWGSVPLLKTFEWIEDEMVELCEAFDDCVCGFSEESIRAAEREVADVANCMAIFVRRLRIEKERRES